jgi:Ca2+/Na+ antiporter
MTPVTPSEDEVAVIARDLAKGGMKPPEIINALVGLGVDRGVAAFVVFQKVSSVSASANHPRGPHRIQMAVVCLHISALLYVLIGLGLCAILAMENNVKSLIPFSLCVFTMIGALVVAIEVIAYGLTKRKFWAWVAGLIMFGIYVPSLFFPLGALGLWGLLDENSRREFGVR